jgi:pimeloyl-ACP methyl ester carboxylesterase
MAKTEPPTADDFIVPLRINGLEGRMLRIPPKKRTKREIMFVYGHHSSLERWFGVAENLSNYGGVTVPDLPGFGGMDPFYKIGRKPSLDNMADYLAAFIKLRYKNKKFSLVGLSLGFMIITRMLQKYPELTKHIDILVSFAGFTNKSDFRYNRRTFLLFRYGSSFFSRRLPAAFLKYCVFRRTFIKLGYAVFEPMFIKGENTKIRKADDAERDRRINFEVYLWQCNDVRTYMDIAVTMFTLDLRGEHIDLPVHHLSIDADRYFNNLSVEQHMREIYKDFNPIRTKVPAHSPSIIATAKDAEPYIQPFSHLLKKRAK